MSRRKGTQVPSTRIMALLIGALVLVVIVTTVVATFEYRFPSPYWDTTILWHAYFAAQDSGSMSQLATSGISTFEQRVVPLVWFFLLDVWLVRGRGTAMIAGNLAFLALAASCVLWSRRRGTDLSLAEWTAVAGLMATPPFSAMHIALARPVMVAQYAQRAFCFLAFVAAAALDRRLREDRRAAVAWPLAGIIAGNLLASFSWGIGLAGWGATLLLAIIRRWPARLIAGLSGAAIATLTAFFFASAGPRMTGISRLEDLKLGTFALHVFNYLANPLARVLSSFGQQATTRAAAQIVTAVALIAAIAWIAGWLRQPRRRRDPFELVALQIMFYCLGAGLLTALARSHLGADQAFAARYSFHALWAWVVPIGLWVGGASPPRRPRRIGMIGIVVVILLVPAQVTGIAGLRGAANHLRPGYLALLAGVNDEAVLERVHPDPAALLELGDRLRTAHLGVFSSTAAGWLGRPFADSFELQAPPLDGHWEVNAIATDPAGAILDGECAADGVDIRWFVVVGPDGTVRGLGAPVLNPIASPGPLRWRAYVPAPPPLEGYRVFAVGPDFGAAQPLRGEPIVAAGDWRHAAAPFTIRAIAPPKATSARGAQAARSRARPASLTPRRIRKGLKTAACQRPTPRGQKRRTAPSRRWRPPTFRSAFPTTKSSIICAIA